ncbi:hypothetical protein MIND_01365100 [Mycena indigotica]|uniref:Uncharacterized protein n=1 Tax=Mycena indigotica TaxID=2126181 RepID=A0A8H6S110_9AGAR|nr:uncharacterized protein MIND_01365100 [Mycena indigotica]KAF7289902.1 hypothetical protein MIND_01365100 [Mycena indigotica]
MQYQYSQHLYASGGSMRHAPYPIPNIAKSNQKFYRPHHRPARAPTQVDDRPADHWHDPKNLLSINYGSKEQFPYSISFQPLWGPCKYGVALLNLENGQGMKQGEAKISEELPPIFARYPTGTLIIDWPGYRQDTYILTLVDPATRRHVTRAQLGAQVTHYFKEFANTRQPSDYDERSEGFYLGVDGVSYDQVRLSEVYTKDGHTFRVQFGLVPHFLSVQ